MKLLKNNELDNDANVYVILGQVGTGKTSLVNSHKGKRLVLSFDDSYSALKRDDGLQVVADITSQELLDTDNFLEELSGIAKGYDLVVFDNISALQQTIVDDLVAGRVGRNKDGRAAYGTAQTVLRQLVRWSTKFKTGDVLFTLWSKVEKGFEMADMNSTAFSSVAGYAKVVGRTYVDKNYMVSLQPSLSGVAKNRVNKIDVTLNSKFWEAVEYREDK